MIRIFKKYARAGGGKRGKLWYRLALSYVCMLLVAALFAWILIYDAYKRVNQDYSDNGASRARIAADQMDILQSSMNAMDWLLIRSAVRMTFMNDPNVFNEIQLVKTLKDFSSISAEDYDTFLCWTGRDSVYDDGGKYEPYVYWSSRLGLAGREGDRDKWLALTSPTWMAQTTDSGKTRIFYVFPLRQITMNGYDKDAFVVNTFTNEALDKRMRAALGYDFDGEYYLFSGDTPLYFSGSEADAQLRGVLANWTDGALTARAGDSYYFGVCAVNSALRVLICQQSFKRTEMVIQYLETLFAFGIPLALFGVLLALCFTHANYRPIRSVVSRLNAQKSDARDEYGYIISSIDAMKRDERARTDKLMRQEEMIKRQGETLRRQALMGLLRGEARADGAQDAPDNLGVMCVRLRGRGILGCAAAQARVEAFALENGFDAIDCEDIHAMVLLKPDAVIEDAAARLAASLSSFAPCIGASRAGANGEGVSRAYLEAIAACDETERSERAWSRFDISGINYSTDSTLNQQMIYLRQAMQTGNEALCEKYARDVLLTLRGLRYIDQKRSRFLLINMISQDIDAWQLATPADEMFIAVQTEEFERFCEQMSAIVMNVCEQIQKKNAQRSSESISAILAQVRARALDYDVSVDELCRALNMTENRLTRLIKEETGCTPREYVIRLRMEAAKRMLLETAHSVSVIAERVGYGSASHFIKLFKQYYGMTPSRFRSGGK